MDLKPLVTDILAELRKLRMATVNGLRELQLAVEASKRPTDDSDDWWRTDSPPPWDKGDESDE